MDISIFTQRFLNIAKEIKDVSLIEDDEIAYLKLFAHLDFVSDKLSDASEDERIALFNNEAENFYNNYDNYKLNLKARENLSDIHIKRITALNKIEFLFYQQINKIPYGEKLFNFDIMANMFQGALAAGLNGPHHKLFLEELLNREGLTKAIEITSHQRPVVDKYGKSISVKDKKTISEKSIDETMSIAKKVLGEGPKEILARYPDYKYGLPWD